MRGALEKLVSRPGVYDLVQTLAGASVVRRHLAAIVPNLPAGAAILDVGAGTGLYRSIWSENWRYICLDLDPLKLSGFRWRHRDAVIQGDASRLPVADASVDAVACTLMSHHLDDDTLMRMLKEVVRVLKPGGAFLFADPVWQPSRLPGRLLWRCDRGRHPRRQQALKDHISARFRIERWDDFAVWHRYVACLAINP